MIKTFHGFKGKMAGAQIGDIQFVILAPTARQLETLWTGIMTTPLDPAGIKSAILIEASTLPDHRVNIAPISPISPIAPIDV